MTSVYRYTLLRTPASRQKTFGICERIIILGK